MAEESVHDAKWFAPSGLIPPLIALLLFIGFFQLVPTVAGGETARFVWSWSPSLGVNLSFLVDGLSLTFSLLITGIGFLVMLYSARYLAGHPQRARFSLYLTAFMLSMLGLVLSDNLIGLFVFWELTTITSYLLIGFSHASENSRRSALQALFVTGAGGLALLAGFIVIGSVTGTYELSEIRGMGDVLRDHAGYVPILILVLAGAFTKSAQVPFHFWLPNAMAAPTPVSAYLHSATMVKGGVYLLARMHPTLSGTDLWQWSLLLFGAATALFASVVAVRQTDLKQTLAYTTLMALGTLVMFLSSSGAYAVTAAATFLVVHSFYKASLFLMIGCVDYRATTRDAEILGGVARQMPVTALAAALAAFSMAGIPPFLGFIGKELLYKGALAAESSAIIMVLATFLASALMFAVAGIVALRPFWGSSDRLPERNVPEGEAPWQMVLGPLLLAGLGLYFGLFPLWLETVSVAPTVGSLLGDLSLTKHLHLWAGVNTALFLSIATFALGIVLYLFHRQIRETLATLESQTISFDRGWDKFLVLLGKLARSVTLLVQSGVLKTYMTVVFVTILVALGVAYLRAGLAIEQVSLPDLTLKSYTAFVLTFAGSLMALLTRSRIAAIAGLGVVGIGVALIFIIYGAPDVAITQLLVEVLVVVLFAVAALQLPVLRRRTSTQRPRYGDAALAISIGTLVGLVLLAVTTGPLNMRLTEFFEASSYKEAFGQNIVNVILVDFRAFDTFGEISVVAIAALAAVALLRQKGGGDKT